MDGLRYLVSLPERTLRATAAVVGGLIYETFALVLPDWLRRSHLYQTVVARFLRILVELIGGVHGVLPPEDIDAQTLAVRKAFGNVIEVAGFLAMGWSPLWLLAAAADVTGGTQIYLNSLVSELRRTGLLPEEADVASIDELLNSLEAASGLVADMVDMPPLNVDEMRQCWKSLQQNVAELPNPSRLASLYKQMEEIARKEKRSLGAVSALVAASAMRAGIQVGHTYIYDYFQDCLQTIRKEGLSTYSRRVARPYLLIAAGHFDHRRGTQTERLIPRRRL